MKKVLKKLFSVALGAAMLVSVAFGTKSEVYAATELLSDGGFESATFWEDGNWTFVYDWDAGSTVNLKAYSSDEWLEKSTDGGENTVNYWFCVAGDMTVRQTVDLEAGVYTLKCYNMGENVTITPYVDGVTGTAVAATGWNAWSEVTYSFTLEEAKEDVVIGWNLTGAVDDCYGYIDAASLVKTGEVTPPPQEPNPPQTGDTATMIPVLAMVAGVALMVTTKKTRVTE